MVLQVLPPEALLAVCWLACALLRQAVLPHDLVRWALSGQLPYLLMAQECAAELRSAEAAPPAEALQPRGPPPSGTSLKSGG